MQKLVEDTIYSYLSPIFKKHYKKESIMFKSKNRSLSYQALDERIEELTKGLIAAGVQKGEHVAVLAPASPEWVALLLACSRMGAVLVCLNDNSHVDELKYSLNHSDSTILFTTATILEKIQDACPNMISSKEREVEDPSFPQIKKIVLMEEQKDSLDIFEFIKNGEHITTEETEEREGNLSCYDPVTIHYTSGTTGNAKAVLSTHYGILNNAIVSSELFEYKETDKVLLALPLYHVMGCVLTAIVILLTGGALVLLERFQTKAALRAIEEEHCTSFHGVGTMYQFMMSELKNDTYDIRSLKQGMIGGSICPPKKKKEIMSSLGIENLTNIYGQTEAMAITQTLRHDSDYHNLHTVGRLVPGVTCKIINPETKEELPIGSYGELIVKTPYVMMGYYKDKANTDKTIQDGWLYTGDIASIDKDGYIMIDGRIKDIIIRGGENISPYEIETVLRNHHSIKDAVVVGVNDALMGEAISAFIILKDDVTMIKDEVHEYVLSHLAKHKNPKYVEFVDSFPVTTSGKVQKFKLKKLLEEKYAL